jgi:putative phosphoesterase
MRILVVSDTHGDAWALQRAILEQPKAEVVIHLGDGAEEAANAQASFPERQFYLVRGNCDWGSALPALRVVELGGKRFYCTHGMAERVKDGEYEAILRARSAKADVLLFGHTHMPISEYREGLYILNPGSLHGAGATYGFVDVTPAGIVTQIVRLR